MCIVWVGKVTAPLFKPMILSWKLLRSVRDPKFGPFFHLRIAPSLLDPQSPEDDETLEGPETAKTAARYFCSRDSGMFLWLHVMNQPTQPMRVYRHDY